MDKSCKMLNLEISLKKEIDGLLRPALSSNQNSRYYALFVDS